MKACARARAAPALCFAPAARQPQAAALPLVLTRLVRRVQANCNGPWAGGPTGANQKMSL